MKYGITSTRDERQEHGTSRYSNGVSLYHLNLEQNSVPAALVTLPESFIVKPFIPYNPRRTLAQRQVFERIRDYSPVSLSSPKKG